MNERIAYLRQKSLDEHPWLSIERAKLVTEFYRETKETSVPLRRAMALKYIMENKEIYIGDRELIVGERGPAPKGTPTFPELCCHTEEDLEILDTREKISYAVTDEAKNAQREQVIPY